MLETISNLIKRNRLIFDLSVILLFAVVVTIPMLIEGIPGLYDTPQQFQIAQSMYDSLANGDFYLSWADQPNFGLGDVVLRFYPPATYFALSFFRLIAGNWFDATLLFFISLYFLSGVGVYLWSRESFAENASLAGSLVYILLPYHIMQIYLGALFAEFTAVAILPFCFLFVTRVCQKGRLIDILCLALSFGLLILTHLPTTIIASLTFLIYVLFSLKKHNFAQTILKLSGAIGVSLLLSSFYWVRMITELQFVKHNSEAFYTGFYSYKTQFVFSNLFVFADIRPTSHTALMNMIATITLGIFISHLFFHIKKAQTLVSVKPIFIASIFALIMSTPLSLFAWEGFPLLQKIQFPYRWLTIFSLGTAYLVSAGFSGLIENFKSSKRYLSILALGIIVIAVPYTYFRMVHNFLPYPKDYLTQVVDRFKQMPSCECWWTSWVKVDTSQIAKSGMPRPVLLTDKVVLNNRVFTIQSWAATERIFTIEAGQAGQVQVATMFYPHWKATVNDQSVEVTPTETGMISVPVPTEASKVRLYFQEPQYVLNAYYISGMGWIIFLSLLAFTLFQTNSELIKKWRKQSQNS